MMHSGRMDRRITLWELLEADDGHGGVEQGWFEIATVWAELREARTREFMERSGPRADDVRRAFRIRWRDGVNTSLRVIYQGETLNIVEIAELGRRDGLELRCTSIGAE